MEPTLLVTTVFNRNSCRNFRHRGQHQNYPSRNLLVVLFQILKSLFGAFLKRKAISLALGTDLRKARVQKIRLYFLIAVAHRQGLSTPPSVFRT